MTYFSTGPETDENNKCYWVSFLDGTQRVLLFTDQAGIAHEAQSISQLEVVSNLEYTRWFTRVFGSFFWYKDIYRKNNVIVF